MELNYTQSYDGTPQQVVELMRNPDFLNEVAQQAGALEHAVSLQEQTARIDMRLSSPADLTKFIGQSFEVTQSISWGEPKPDGSFEGKIDVLAKNLPVTMVATGLLSPVGDAASKVSIQGELKVNVPLFGKQIEKQVEPFITTAFDGLHRRAQQWLAR